MLVARGPMRGVPVVPPVPAPHDHGLGRRCACGSTLSRYNEGPRCYACQITLDAVVPVLHDAAARPMREAVLYALGARRATVAQVADQVGIERNEVSKCLERLRASGKVTRSGEPGRWWPGGGSGGYVYERVESEDPG